MWQLSLPATEEFLWKCRHRSLTRLKPLKKSVFHAEQYPKSRKTSINKKLTCKEESWSILYLEYIHNSTIAEVDISLNHTILSLWYSLVDNFFLCGHLFITHLSPVSLEISFSDTSNSYSNGLWRVSRKDRVIQTRFMSSQEPNSPQCHILPAGSAGGCGNGTSCRI